MRIRTQPCLQHPYHNRRARCELTEHKDKGDLPDTVVEVELEHGHHQLHHLLRVVGEVLLQLPANRGYVNCTLYRQYSTVQTAQQVVFVTINKVKYEWAFFIKKLKKT
jgi:hypothetical protein